MRSRRSRAGRRSLGKRVWRVRRAGFWGGERVSVAGCGVWVGSFWLEVDVVAIVLVREVRRRRVDGRWWAESVILES